MALAMPTRKTEINARPAGKELPSSIGCRSDFFIAGPSSLLQITPSGTQICEVMESKSLTRATAMIRGLFSPGIVQTRDI